MKLEHYDKYLNDNDILKTIVYYKLINKLNQFTMKTKVLKSSGLVFVLVVSLIFTSCSKSKTAKDDIVGTWGSASYTVTTTVSGMPLLQYLTTVLGYPEATAQLVAGSVNSGLQQQLPGQIQIKSDGTYTATSTSGTDTGTWSLSSDNKKLTIVPSTGDPIIFDVITLSSSSLHLKWTETTSQDLNSDGTPETLTFAIDLTLSK